MAVVAVAVVVVVVAEADAVAEPTEDCSMKPRRHSIDELPTNVRTRILELQRSLETILGNDLVAFLLFGSVVRGGYQQGQSDIDAVVVLSDDARNKLDAIANALRLARYSARIETMILTASEIPRAADVFPLFYDDIRECHLLLSGRDPFKDLTISPHHCRLRIEQELREIQIRLRRAVVDAGGDERTLAAALSRKIKQLRGPLHALLKFHGPADDDTLEAVLDSAARIYSLDLAPLRRIQEAPNEAHAALARLLAAAIDDVDRREEHLAATA